eukprot:jgi/Mesen1/2274/ME000154S01441
MAQALWNGVIIATCPVFQTVEGNVYFPPDSLNMQYFKPSSTQTTCGWKGVAKYYTVEVNGQQNKDAAWYYPEPKAAANNIKDHVAFWKGVKVNKGTFS